MKAGWDLTPGPFGQELEREGERGVRERGREGGARERERESEREKQTSSSVFLVAESVLFIASSNLRTCNVFRPAPSRSCHRKCRKCSVSVSETRSDKTGTVPQASGTHYRESTWRAVVSIRSCFRPAISKT